MPYHVRMAELTILQKQRPLTEAELLDMTHCMAANLKYCWDLVALQNKSLAAYMVGDMGWLHEICAEIEALESHGVKIDRPKK